MTVKKVTALFLSAVLAVSALAGCAGGGASTPADASQQGSSAAGQDAAGKTLTIATSEFMGMDGYQLQGTSLAHPRVISSILTMQPDGTIGPGVAEGYAVSEDGKTITITMPEGFRFAGGEDLTPEDLKRSIEWGLEVSPMNYDYDVINKIEVDGQDVILHLDEFTPAILFMMTSSFMPILRAEQIDSLTADELLWQAVPYGEYSLVEYVEGSHLSLKRNEYYKTNNALVENKGPMAVENITIRLIEDDFARMNSILANEIDLTFDYPPTLLDELAKNEDMTYGYFPHYGLYRIILNNDYPLFADPAVREAIMLLVDHKGIAEFSEGSLSEDYGYLPDSAVDYLPDAGEYYKSKYSYDPEAAAALLAEAGWADTDGDGYLDKDGTTLAFTLSVRERASFGIISEYMQIKLRDAGIKMDIAVLDLAVQINELMVDDTYQASLQSMSWGNGSTFLPNLTMDSNLLPDDTYFAMAKEATANPDDAERAKALDEAQQYLMDQKYVIPVARMNNLLVYNKATMDGIVISVNGEFYINDVK